MGFALLRFVRIYGSLVRFHGGFAGVLVLMGLLVYWGFMGFSGALDFHGSLLGFTGFTGVYWDFRRALAGV